MSLKNRINEIVFTENYSIKDWNTDWPVLDTYVGFFDEQEQQSTEDAFINIINNEHLTEKSKQRMIFALIEPVISNPALIKKFGVRKAFQIAKQLSPKHKGFQRFKKQ